MMEKNFKMWRAFVEPCVPGVLKDGVQDMLSLNLMLISSQM